MLKIANGEEANGGVAKVHCSADLARYASKWLIYQVSRVHDDIMLIAE